MRQPVPFGKYLLLDRISVGGMAEVFKAKSYGVEGFEKIIAIKRILPTMGEDRDFIKMFIDEAKIAGQLAHANICQIFELGRIDGSHFIAMEYIWGKDLLQIQNRLRKIKQAMPIPMACFAIAKVLEGLDYAHRRRDPLGRPLEIVHRDCSPQNVLVSYEGEVKVIDFGIAKATSRNSRTMAGVLKGKFGYMSPEQVRGLPLDRRSDIFALGTMLYECLTGDRLFQGETDFSTLEKVRNVDIRRPREINPNIPGAVEAVILKALAKDVDERYQWCSEMLADLQAFLMNQDAVVTAKSLSSWLKEVFAAEIDRERKLLEEYRGVGHEGVFDGVPAAASKANVVESFGDAPPVDGDPTTLGGPSFDDIEQAAGAAPEVGPAPGSPAARGGPLDDEEDSGAFGEEAPTEIFGEIDHGANPAVPSPVPRAPTSQPVTRPPRPPPSRPPTTREPSYANPAEAGAPYQHYAQPGDYPQAAGAPTGSQPIALGTPGAMPVGQGAPGSGPVATAASQARTLLGAPAPAGLPSYAQGYPGPPMQQPMPSSQQTLMQPPGQPMPSSQQTLMQPPGGMPQQPMPSQPMQPYPMHPSQPMPPMQPPYGMAPGHPAPQMHPRNPSQPMPMQGQHPSQPMYAQHPSQPMPMQGYPPPPYPPQMQPNPYQQPQGYPPAGNPMGGAVEAPGAGKKSSIVRDVAIGVAIAALVLGAFLIVKVLFIDGDSAPNEAGPSPTGPATIHLAMPAGVSAHLFVDDKNVATVSDKQDIAVTAGLREVKLVGPNGMLCQRSMKLVASKTATLDCSQGAASGSGGAAAGAGSASVSSGSAAASAATAGSGSSAGSATATGAGSGATAGSGSATASAAAAGSAAGSGARTAPDKTDKMPVEDKTDRASATRSVDSAPRSSDKPRPKPPDTDDDLGKLQGGTKPGAPRPIDVKKPVDGSVDRAGSRASPDERSYLTVTSKPVARIFVDGTDTGLSTPIAGYALPIAAGKHKISFVIGTDKFTFQVTVKSAEILALHKDLQ